MVFSDILPCILSRILLEFSIVIILIFSYSWNFLKFLIFFGFFRKHLRWFFWHFLFLKIYPIISLRISSEILFAILSTTPSRVFLAASKLHFFLFWKFIRLFKSFRQHIWENIWQFLEYLFFFFVGNYFWNFWNCLKITSAILNFQKFS